MSKCKYWKECNLYSENSKTCISEGGMYNQDRPSGCYLLMEKKIKENNKSFTTL